MINLQGRVCSCFDFCFFGFSFYRGFLVFFFWVFWFSFYGFFVFSFAWFMSENLPYFLGVYWAGF